MGLVNRAFRNVWRKKTRTIIVILLLGVSVASIISVYSGVEASVDNTQEMIDEYEQHIVETGDLNELQERMIQVSSFGAHGGRGMGGGMFQIQTSNITQDVIENIELIDYVETVIPIIESPAGEIDFEEMREQMQKLRESGEFNPGGGGPGDFGGMQDRMMSLYDYIIMGVPVSLSLDETYLILPENIISGTKIIETDESMVMLLEDLTFSDGFFAGVKVGDTVDINGYNFTVAGIYTSDTSRNYVYMNIEDARKILGITEGEAYSLNVYAEDLSYIEWVSEYIEELYQGEYVVTSYSDMYSQISERRQNEQEAEIASLQEDSGKIENTGNSIIVFLIIAVAIIVLFLMMYTVKERTKEIGLMKAIGFKGKSVMYQFIIEGTAIGIIGGMIGVIIGVIFGPVISKALLPNSEVFATATPSFTIVFLVLCLTIMLGAIGTIFPAWQASRKSPMEAMRNE